jgi:hypothetical protein
MTQNRMAPLDTEAGQLSAITTMALMQMVADPMRKHGLIGKRTQIER